jgi:hypothetical protein
VDSEIVGRVLDIKDLGTKDPGGSLLDVRIALADALRTKPQR